MIDKNEVKSALSEVIDPELRRNIVELGMVKEVDIDGGAVAVEIALTIPACPMKDKITGDIEAEIKKVSGVESVDVTTRGMSDSEKKTLGEKLRGPAPSLSVAQSTRMIAVGSGKGGVGKSTITVNLAAFLAGQGYSVGLLDADIWGFSVPRMLGIHERPGVRDNRIIPVENYGLKIMSTGFFVSEETPVIWRGPLVHRAMEQFLTEVDWGELDYLFVDLPPGTGDVMITLAKLAENLDVIMVTTPQTAAAKVAVRSGHMAHKADVPVIGVIENMSYFTCDSCKDRNYLFGQGGGAELAKALGAPLLGQVPFDPLGREGSDAGEPVVLARPESPLAQAFTAIADRIEPGRQEKTAKG